MWQFKIWRESGGHFEQLWWTPFCWCQVSQIYKPYLKPLVFVLFGTESVSFIKRTLSQHSWSTPAIWPPLNFHTMFVSSLPWRHESVVEAPLLGEIIQVNKWISLDIVAVTSQTLKIYIYVYRSMRHFSAVYYIFFNIFVCGCVL
jgi:hypothetical protein